MAGNDKSEKGGFAFQIAMLEKGYDQVQTQIIHLDEILFKIKASAITVWVALMGWSFTSQKVEIIPLGVVVIIGFWFLEAMYKGVQIRYIEASKRLMAFVNDNEKLKRQFEKQQFTPGIVYPVALEISELDRLIMLIRGLISPTVATVYLFLGFSNVLVLLYSSGVK